MAAADPTTAEALDSLWECACSPGVNALIQRMRAPLDHELLGASNARAQRDLDRRSAPRPRFRSWEDEAADAAGVRARGEI